MRVRACVRVPSSLLSPLSPFSFVSHSLFLNSKVKFSDDVTYLLSPLLSVAQTISVSCDEEEGREEGEKEGKVLKYLVFFDDFFVWECAYNMILAEWAGERGLVESNRILFENFPSKQKAEVSAKERKAFFSKM